MAGGFVGLAAVLLGTLDLVLAWPFSAVTPVFDVGHVLSGTILLYLSGNAYRDCVR